MMQSMVVILILFLSTLSLRRATMRRTCHKCDSPEFLSTLSLRRATYDKVSPPPALKFLSTLSLRRATPRVAALFGRCYFYPRSPCGERLFVFWTALRRPLFLSTLSLRRATQTAYFFNAGGGISIHALLAESDVSTMIITTCTVSFLSTLSLRRATNFGLPFILSYSISIHALLAESDYLTNYHFTLLFYISIHALLAESDNMPRDTVRVKL